MVTRFLKCRDRVSWPIVINNKSIEVVPHAKLLGLTISNDFKWNKQGFEVVKKTALIKTLLVTAAEARKRRSRLAL